MAVLVVWIALAAAVAAAAGGRGRSRAGWFLLAVVFSPLLAGLAVLVLPDRRIASDLTALPTYYDPALGSAPGARTKPCPDCGETVRASARLCRFCRHDFSADAGD